MEGYYYGYCILEQSRIRDEKYKQSRSSTSSISSTVSGKNAETPRRSPSSSQLIQKTPKRNNGFWIYNKIYGTFD
jgi:hypothetical protein